jgi:hypothetical protein
MKNLRIYDNGGATFDRYTVVYMDRPEYDGFYECLGMSENALGFCQHSSAMIGSHLGKPIKFKELPIPCQLAAMKG